MAFDNSANKSGNEGEGDQEMDQDQNRTELTQVEIALCKQNFGFYDTKKVGSVERFELPMLLNGKSCFHTQIKSSTQAIMN